VDAHRTSSEPAVYIGATHEDLWQHATLRWFERVLPQAWQSRLPSLVVTPNRSFAAHLKEQLLAAGKSHLGVRFVTARSLRELLSDEPLPLREHLRLLLALAAERQCDDPDEAVQLAAKSVMRAPEHLLRAIDRFEIAGWRFEGDELRAFSPIVECFRAMLRECNLELVGEHDRELGRDAPKQPKQFAHVLIAGFDASHWSSWHLLQAAIAAAQNATVLLSDPISLSPAETCWIGSWEERFGEAQRVEAPVARTGDLLFSEAEMRGDSTHALRTDFLVGENSSEQAHAIALCCARYLAEPACTRVIIGFPAADALPRLVSAALEKLHIVHNDALAHPLPGVFESAAWRAWIALQRAPRVATVAQFFRALPEGRELFPEISSEKAERVLRDVYAEVLLDDLRILRAACADSQREDEQLVARLLGAFHFLPERATLSGFLDRTKTALRQLGWEQQRIELANRTSAWLHRLDVELTRRLFLRWLEETAASFGAERASAGDHPYARVQLLTIADAQGQRCSHLILAGSNEGAWPPPASGEFAREQAIDAFNRQARQLNRRSTRRGRQGEGHTSIRDGHAFYLGARERREIAQQQIVALLESATNAVAFTASLTQEDAPERLWNPSELFTRSYLHIAGKALSESALRGLQRTTRRWIADTRLTTTPEEPRAGIEQTLVAFKARRDPTQSAGEYDFALRPNESAGAVPTLSVSDFEAMLKTPALVWLKRYVGLEAPDEAANPWTAATGKWVHRWLANIAAHRDEQLFTRLPSPAQIDQRVGCSADEKRAFVQRLCRSAGKTLPDWWNSGWLNARYLARHLASKIAAAEDWPWISTELPIGRDGPVNIAPDVSLLLRGQIDLVLAKNDGADFTAQSIWIVDYKTGSTDALKSSDLHDRLVKGTALQLGLYSLALRSLNAASVQMSIVSLAVKNVAPQLEVDALAPHTDIFANLAEMQQTGVFGMKGEVRPSFGARVTYPLATLPIDVDVLEDKWALTHSALVLEKEEWEVW
jgi:hypothetical protein